MYVSKYQNEIATAKNILEALGEIPFTQNHNNDLFLRANCGLWAFLKIKFCLLDSVGAIKKYTVCAYMRRFVDV